MTDEGPDGRPLPEVMERVLARVTHLKCGECDYDETDTVANHEAHAAAHKGGS